jgi:hypothetical protein
MFFVLGFAVIIGLGAVGATVGAPSEHLCRPYRPCGPLRVMRPLVNETVWRSSRYGFTLEYPGNEASISQQGPTGLILDTRLNDGNTGTILVQAFPTSSPTQAIRTQVGELTGVSQVAADTLPADQLLGGGVGYRPGAGEVFTGFFSSPQGVATQVSLASEAATAHGVTVSVIVAGPSSDAGPNTFLYLLGDQIINSVRWPGGS